LLEKPKSQWVYKFAILCMFYQQSPFVNFVNHPDISKQNQNMKRTKQSKTA